MHISSRRKMTLDGEWAFEVDPDGVGDRRRVWECRKESRDGRPEDIDVGAFRTMRVPGDWNRQFADLGYYEGLAWYHRRVERPAGWAGRRAFLYFEAVNYEATVYWNGEEVSRHEGGFTPFCVEVTGRIKAQNDLVVRVDSSRRPDGLPPGHFDWFNYGGITRSVWLVLAPKVYVRDFTVTTRIEKKKPSAEIAFDVVGARAGGWARVMLPEIKRERETTLDA